MARILIVDDDLGMRKMLEETLAAEGHTILLAEDGKQAIQRLRAGQANLVITDIFMPEKDGLEFMLDLRTEFPTLPVIAISGNPIGMNALKVAKKLGAATTLEKPFHPSELSAAIRQALIAYN